MSQPHVDNPFASPACEGLAARRDVVLDPKVDRLVIDCELGIDDFLVAGAHLNWHNRIPWRDRLVTAFAVFVLIFAVLAVTLGLESAERRAWYCLFVAALASSFAVLLGTPRPTRSGLAKHRKEVERTLEDWFFEPVRICLSTEGIDAVRPSTWVHTSWKIVKRVELADDLILLWGNTTIHHIIPRQAFVTDEALAQFVALAERYVREAQETNAAMLPTNISG